MNEATDLNTIDTRCEEGGETEERITKTRSGVRTAVLGITLVLAGLALGTQRFVIRASENRAEQERLARLLPVIKQAKEQQAKAFKGPLHDSNDPNNTANRSPLYGEGDEADAFLASNTILPIGKYTSARLGDGHRCPNGTGDCSYGGTLEVYIDDPNGVKKTRKVIVLLQGVGSNGGSTFYVEDGKAVLGQGGPFGDTDALMTDVVGGTRFEYDPPSQEDIKEAIKQCWEMRNATEAESEGTLSRLDERKQELYRTIMALIYHAWDTSTSGS